MAKVHIIIVWLTLLFVSHCKASRMDICKYETPGTRLPYPGKNCSVFVVCEHQRISRIGMCPKGLHFNRKIAECDLPSRAGCDKMSNGNCEFCDCSVCCDEILSFPPTEDQSTFPTEITRARFSPTQAPPTRSTPSEVTSTISFPTETIPIKTRPTRSTSTTKTTSTEMPPTGITPSTSNPSRCPNDFRCIDQEDATHLPVEGHCEKFIVCHQKCPIEQTCASNLHFNPATGDCDFPSSVNCVWPSLQPSTGPSGTICLNGGKCVGMRDGTHFPSNISCNKYIVCQCECEVERICPNDLEFNRELNSCDWPGNSQCLLP